MTLPFQRARILGATILGLAALTAFAPLTHSAQAQTATIVTPANNTSYPTLAQATGSSSGSILVACGLGKRDSAGNLTGLYVWSQGAFDNETDIDKIKSDPAKYAKNAAGTKPWTLDLPALSDGKYVLGAAGINGSFQIGDPVFSFFTIGTGGSGGPDTTRPEVVVTNPTRDLSVSAAAASGATARGLVQDDVEGSGIAGVAVVLYRYGTNGNTPGYWKRDAANDGDDFSESSANATLLTNAATLSGSGRPQNFSITLPTTAQGFKPGKYGIYARASDQADTPNFAQSSIVTFFLTGTAQDGVAPFVRITNPEQRSKGNPSRYSTSVASGGFARGRAVDNAGGSGIDVVRVVLYRSATNGNTAAYWNGTAFVPVAVTAPVETDNTVVNGWKMQLPTTAQGFTAGLYTLRAYARDVAGNLSQTPDTFFLLQDAS